MARGVSWHHEAAFSCSPLDVAECTRRDRAQIDELASVTQTERAADPKQFDDIFLLRFVLTVGQPCLFNYSRLSRPHPRADIVLPTEKGYLHWHSHATDLNFGAPLLGSGPLSIPPSR